MEKNNTKTKRFFKKYGYYILAGVLAIAIILTLTLGVNRTNIETNKEENPVIDVDADPIKFELPLENATILKGFSSTELMYNQTLKQWESHKAIDLISETTKTVVACLDGKVTKVENNFSEGTKIEITHADGFVSTYASLSESLVQNGDTVKKGQALGEMSSSMANENEQGEHLHFVLSKDGNIVDPASYLELSEK